MQMRDLEYFLLVAEHGNLSRASEALDLSHAALSKSLKRLQDSIGVTLLERFAKGMRLTPAGVALLPRVRELRLAMSDTRRHAEDMGAGTTGHVRVGASQIDCEWLSAAMASMLREFPAVTFDILTANNDVMIPALLEGRLDLIFNVFPEVFVRGTRQEKLVDDKFVVCASRTHRLARKRRVTLADVAGERWALSGRDIYSRQRLEKLMMRRGLGMPRVAIESRAVRFRLQAWSQAGLLGTCSRRMLRQCADDFGLVELPIRELQWARPIGVIYRSSGFLPTAGQRLLRALRTEASRLAATE